MPKSITEVSQENSKLCSTLPFKSETYLYDKDSTMIQNFLSKCFEQMSLDNPQKEYIVNNALFVLINSTKPKDQSGLLVGNDFFINRPPDLTVFASSFPDITPALFNMKDISQIIYKPDFLFLPSRKIIFEFTKDFFVFNTKKEKNELIQEYPISNYYNEYGFDNFGKKNTVVIQDVIQKILLSSRELEGNNILPASQVFV